MLIYKKIYFRGKIVVIMTILIPNCKKYKKQSCVIKN